ncbi:hypothetical protein [Xenorhabdus szentirmaii]|uniref:Uncharacterized protein n=2 Tax=Xenorhabdus szentirmaii TaxID=290112 RepID=W1IS34_9GAMM|nr:MULTISPECIES: hypothetical protein [Xenorhabdus]MBD2802999.1 hypothetical protein [Xenorhabdus sp. M]PHM43431.1 hypothetical protein Xszus_03220 [Xenorhabdus szentirmaii]CDL81249.1 conserved hypothetical protein [Xenorhabdus szentirmaii DSM 16338]
MKKISIYSNMLWKSLSYIRNVQTQYCFRKAFDKSCYMESELLHSVVLSIREEDITTQDIFFLNNHAKFYLENADEKKCGNYNFHKENIKALFSIVPNHMKNQLEWPGPQ